MPDVKSMRYTRADTSWEADVRGQGVSVPPRCTCCMLETDGRERIPTPIRLRYPDTVRHRKVYVLMPLCPECRAHRRAFSALTRRVRLFGALFGAAVTFLLLAGLKYPEALSAGAGLAAAAAAYFLLLAFTRTKPIYGPHASRLKTVSVSALGRPGDNLRPSLRFTFANGEYAELFREANGAGDGELTSVKRRGSTGRVSVFRLYQHKATGLARTAAVFALCALPVILCGRNGLYGRIDLRDAMPWMPAFVTAAPPAAGQASAPPRASTAAPTKRPTAVPTKRPTAVPTRKPTAVPTRKPTATPRPTATPSPMPTVRVGNGKMFVKPDYEGTCPLTVEAGAGSNYYVYMKYVSSPSYSLDKRTLKDGARYPYESDVAFYVGAGRSVSLDIPVGVYKLYYATGRDFYGTRYLFGENTLTYDADELLSFYTSKENGTVYSNGHTLTLYTVLNGNFDTDPIPESMFPKR